jgi:deoxyribodipyrimidine photo-lyase
MRAMIVSTAAYPLWLHWRVVGQWLARHFLDYEPGIHWSQMQMQAGTTGINIPRIYNPIKQARDHDPKGMFVRRWIPALRQVPDTWLFEPWHLTPDMQKQFGIRAENMLPIPVVDLEAATRESKRRLYDRRSDTDVKAGKKAIVEKHASRKRSGQTHTSSRRRVNNPAQTPPPTQHALDF